jgi:glycosyltransferase involved in cell wall biosynthesis
MVSDIFAHPCNATPSHANQLPAAHRLGTIGYLVSSLGDGRNAARSHRPLHVAHCIHGLGLGGAQQVIKYITSCGDKNRFRYYVYAGLDGPVRREIPPSDATVRVIRRRAPKLAPVWLGRLAAAFVRDRIDLVHTHLFGDSLHGYYAARLAGSVPVVMTLHNVAANAKRGQGRAYLHLVEKVERAIACSPAAYRSYCDALGAPPNLVMIPNGIPLDAVPPISERERAELRAAVGAGESDLTIGAMGRLVEQKAHSLLISAMRILRPKVRARLVLVGTGPLEKELREQAVREGVAQEVVFTGYRNDTRRLVHAMDVIAFSSTHEGIPMALLEAMAAARPVVSTAVPSMTDVLEDDGTALLVAPRDPDALARAFTRLAEDRRLGARLGAAARAAFESKFTADRMTEQYEAVYAAVAARR